MTYPGLPFGLMIAVAIGTAIYYYFTSESREVPYNYDRVRNIHSLPINDADGRRREFNSTSKEDICAICHDKLKASMTKRLRCNHIFHENCLQDWLVCDRSCPLCRARV